MNIRQAFRLILKDLDITVENLDLFKLSELTAMAREGIKESKKSGNLARLGCAKALNQVDNLTKQRDDLTVIARLAEEEADKQGRIRTKAQKELGWIPNAFDSYKRGIARIAPELSSMAQLAIMELERQADDWNEDDE